MKIALFVGEIGAHGKELMEFLKQNDYSCLTTKLADEVDQLGQQSGQAFLIFTDATFAYRFLSENSWPAFSHFNAVYLPKKPILNPEVQKKLDSRNLKLFDPSTKANLLKAWEGFRPAGLNADADDMELEFTVHEQLKKEK